MENISLDQLKSDPRALDIYRERVYLKKDSSGWVGKCPLHSEKTGSFRVSVKDNKYLWNCFGGCGGGSIIDFIQKLDNLSVKDAIKHIETRLGKIQQVEQTFKPLAETTKKFTITLDQYKKFEDALSGSGGEVFLKKERGINLETAKKCHIGFRQDIGKLSGKGNEDIADKGWLVFPYICDNTVIGMKYRSVVRKIFVHQPGMKTGLFNLEK